MDYGPEFIHDKRFLRVTFSKIGLGCFIPIGLGSFLGLIIELFSIKRLFSDDTISNMIMFSVMVVTLFVNASIMINFYPILKITERGLGLRMFFFRSLWIFIPWTEIISITRSYKTFQRFEIWEISHQYELPKYQNYLKGRLGDASGPTILISSDLERKTAFLDKLSEYIDCGGLN
jgi:hypothetical protein